MKGRVDVQLNTRRFDLGDGTTISFETRRPTQDVSGTLENIGLPDRTVEALSAALSPLRQFAGVLREALAAAAPDKTEIEFGVKVEGKTDLIVTSGGAEANLKVTLTWERT